MPFFKHNKDVLPRSRRLEKMTEKNGLKHMIFNTVGDRYIGEWKKNEKTGKGIIYAVKKKEIYQGNLERNFRHGFGILAHQLPDLKVYTLEYRGDWKNGHMSGHGFRIYKDGSFYLGFWKNSKRHGYGQMWYADKSFYDGQWVKDVREGQGLWVRADGNRYEGDWLADMKHGKGRFFHLDTGQMQEGVWWEDYCNFSIMFDLPFRQSSYLPTMYAIPPECLVNSDDICCYQEWKALNGIVDICFEEEEEDNERYRFSANTLPASHISCGFVKDFVGVIYDAHKTPSFLLLTRYRAVLQLPPLLCNVCLTAWYFHDQCVYNTKSELWQ